MVMVGVDSGSLYSCTYVIEQATSDDI